MLGSLFLWSLIAIGASGNQDIEMELYERSAEIVDIINKLNTTWKAEVNANTIKSVTYLSKMAHHSPRAKRPRSRDPIIRSTPVDLPENFDSRDKWPHCETIGLIRSQSLCMGGWAQAGVAAISDRHCIHSDGRVQVNISAQDVLDCCNENSFGCLSGFSTDVWDYWMDTGIVTGGLYNTSEGCKPFLLPPMRLSFKEHQKHHIAHEVQGPKLCVQKCREGYGKDYFQDRHFANTTYNLAWDEKMIRAEIYENGPVEATMVAYFDFPLYKSGIYQQTWGGVLFEQSVKLIGWGVEDNTPYWLAANSWDTDWGDNGFFKILRGVNECEIEEVINCGLPKI